MRRKSRPPKRIAVISCSAMRAVKFAIYPKDRRCFITNLCLVLFARNGSGGAAGAMGQGARVRFVAFQTGSFGSVALVVWFLGLVWVALELLCTSWLRNQEEAILTLQTKNIT